MKYTLEISGSSAAPKLTHEFEEDQRKDGHERGSHVSAKRKVERLIPIMASTHYWRFVLLDEAGAYICYWEADLTPTFRVMEERA